MPSIMDIFRANPNANKDVTPVKPSDGGRGGNNNPANAIIPAAAPGQVGSVAEGDKKLPVNADKTAPLDSFTKLWDTAPSKTADPTQLNLPRLDQAKLAEGVGKMSFTRNVDPALAQKAINGDAEAFIQVLDAVGREAFSTAFQASDKYNGQILTAFDSSVNARIPKEIGRREANALVRQDLKSLDHPAVIPLLETVQRQMQALYPDASPQEIAKSSREYLGTIAGLITNQSESDTNSQKAAGQNNQTGRRPSVITDFSSFESPQQ